MNETEYLAGLIRQKSSPLFPIRAELPPEWEALVPKNGEDWLALKMSGIKAFIFDLYGTLFISGAGEIGAANDLPGNPPEISSGAAPESNAAGSGENPALLSMKRYFRAEVTAFHETAKAAGKAFPEVRVEEIWAGYDGPFPKSWGQALSARKLAVLYELAVNPVYPMPGAAETIDGLAGRSFVLGIISNAQFFSPLLFDAFFGKTPSEKGFDPRLLVWSFEEREAKPSARLFKKTITRLKELGIGPNETVYIGNDMKNDIVPAAAAGFATALFAGDRRSLRLRDMEPQAKSGEQAVPSLVIRDLQSLLEIR
ncbi:MAG: HAD family hydrolase [Treponema sp.]|jgi:putative hydrolase of the HAD superfamily|nr:HAD family hydrolase [Treponema sp.]